MSTDRISAASSSAVTDENRNVILRRRIGGEGDPEGYTVSSSSSFRGVGVGGLGAGVGGGAGVGNGGGVGDVEEGKRAPQRSAISFVEQGPRAKGLLPGGGNGGLVIGPPRNMRRI